MIDIPAHVRFRIDPSAKTITVEVYVLAAEGEGDVVVFSHTQSASDFTATQRRRLRHLIAG